MEHAEETTQVRLVRIEKDVSEVRRHVGSLRDSRSWFIGALAVIGVMLALVPWMVERAVEQVLIKNKIIRYEKGGEK